MDDIYEGFGFTKADPVNDNLDALGYGTTLLLYNVGSLILPIISYPVMLIIYALIRFLSFRKIPYIETKKPKLQKLLFWSHPIVTIRE